MGERSIVYDYNGMSKLPIETINSNNYQFSTFRTDIQRDGWASDSIWLEKHWRTIHHDNYFN